MLTIKTGVTPRSLTIAAAIANTADDLKLPLVITSGTDGVHMSGSFHYTGDALDMRTRNLTKAQIKSVIAALKSHLGIEYELILESDHLHIEHDGQSH
jgi:hypothetical protein